MHYAIIACQETNSYEQKVNGFIITKAAERIIVTEILLAVLLASLHALDPQKTNGNLSFNLAGIQPSV